MTTTIHAIPCANCGTTKDSRRRTDGSRIGFAGKLCKRCYDRIRIREKRAGATVCKRQVSGESPRNNAINPLDHQGLVYSIAFRYRGRGVELDDLVQEGQFGLFRAAEKFDPARGCMFSTYAMPWIEHFIQRAVQDQSAFVRVPIYLQQRVRKGDGPDTPGLSDKQREAFAAAIRLSKVKVARSSDLAAKNFTLAEIVEDRVSESPGDDEVQKVVRAILGLDSRHRRVLRLLYGLGGHPPLLPREVAVKLGISRERVRQLSNEAISKLRKRLAPELRYRDRRAG